MEIGDKIYNKKDNHFGIIIELLEDEFYNKMYLIKPENGTNEYYTMKNDERIKIVETEIRADQAYNINNNEIENVETEIETEIEIETKIDYKNLKVGDRIYNHGDMANISHFGTVIKVIDDKWGKRYLIQPDKKNYNQYHIPSHCISPIYKNLGTTRFVTEQEYKRWHKELLEQYNIN